MKYQVQQIANFFLEKGREENIQIAPMKLITKLKDDDIEKYFTKKINGHLKADTRGH